jgi:hypothetical protein
MSQKIQVVEDYESEDEGFGNLFGDTTQIPPDRRKQLTTENITIDELKRLIAEKEQQKIVEDTDEEEDYDAKQITYQGVNYILGADNIVITEDLEIVGEWDGNKIIDWEPTMKERHEKLRVSK